MSHRYLKKPAPKNPVQGSQSNRGQPSWTASEAGQDVSENAFKDEAYRQNRFEAFGLQLKEERGRCTTEEQGQLKVLQAKMADYWTEYQEHGPVKTHHLDDIAIFSPQATSSTPSAGPIQTKAVIQCNGRQKGGGKSRNASKLQHRIKRQQDQQRGRFEASAPKREQTRLSAKAKKKRKQAAKEKRRQMQAVYMGLDDDHAWQEIIDGDHHEHGAETFDKGLHAPSSEEWQEYGYNNQKEMVEDNQSYAEPGYLDSAMKARKLVAKSVGMGRMNANFLMNIHSSATQHRKKDPSFKPGLRGGGDRGVHVSYNEDTDYQHGDPVDAMAEVDTNVAKPFTIPLESGHLFDDQDNLDFGQAPNATGNESNLGIWFKPKKKAAVKKDVDRVFSDYYSGLANKRTRREKLLHIATMHRRLENIHAFRDGNSRTNRLILHRMLVENGMNPAIIDNPLQVHLKSNEEWADTLETGMGEWREAREAQNEE